MGKAVDLEFVRAKVDLLKVLIVAIVLWCYHSGFGVLLMVFKHWKNLFVLEIDDGFNKPFFIDLNENNSRSFLKITCANIQLWTLEKEKEFQHNSLKEC